ncbi:MAG: DNA alkylation repair protein [Selenomonadaceae bacterium]|nr:DNA alkylation repair protein [Selenomonadaceae bacterium]
MNFEKLHEKLFELKDDDYKKFQSKLLPTVNPEKIIGVRTPALCKLAKKFFQENDAEIFLNNLPHKYFEENSLHVLLINEMKKYSECVQRVKNFLPFVDNWANCDSLIPKIFKKHTDELEKEINFWLDSNSTYKIRFGISMLMKFYLEKNFDEKYLRQVAEIKSDEYYVMMMSAWYFAEALIKQYNSAIIFLEKNFLSQEVHNKTIQKAVESRRISKERKIYLKSLRRKK